MSQKLFEDGGRIQRVESSLNRKPTQRLHQSVMLMNGLIGDDIYGDKFMHRFDFNVHKFMRDLRKN